MSAKPKARLENWTIGRVHGERRISLFGEVYDHPCTANSRPVVTSNLLFLDVLNKVAETENTIYTLGNTSDAVLERYHKIHEHIDK